MDGHKSRSKATRILSNISEQQPEIKIGDGPDPDRVLATLHDRVKETSTLSRASAEQQRHLLKAAVEEGESSKGGMMEDNPVGTRTRTQNSTHHGI